MNEQKQIEEIARLICGYRCNQVCTLDGCICNYDCAAYDYAKRAYQIGYRKIPENAVVLTREELNDLEYKAYARGVSSLNELRQKQLSYARKETVEKFAERVKADVSEDNELHEALNYYLKRDYFEYIDEICKELVGENGKT